MLERFSTAGLSLGLEAVPIWRIASEERFRSGRLFLFQQQLKHGYACANLSTAPPTFATGVLSRKLEV